MSPLFDHQNYFGFKFIGEDFPDFSQPGFYFFANGGSDFVMPPGIFHVHEHLELKSRRASTSSYTYQPVIHEERTFATKDSSIPGLPSQGEILISAQNDKSKLSAHIGICSYF